MEPLQIVSPRDQRPLQGNFRQPAQRELLKTQNPLNNPNDWFDTRLAAQIAAATFRSSPLLFHRHQHRCRIPTGIFTPLILTTQVIRALLTSFLTLVPIGSNALVLDFLVALS